MFIDPRGIVRKITAAEWSCTGTDITFECGHHTTYAPHFSPPKLGTTSFCHRCGKEAKAKQEVATLAN